MEDRLAGPKIGFFDQLDLAIRCKDDVSIAAGQFGEAVSQFLFAEIVEVLD